MQLIDLLWNRGKEFLGCDYAILGGAMSWVSERNLVAAISNAGGFGVIACGSMSPDLLEKEIVATKLLTNKLFGVNLIVMHPALLELVDVCIKHNVSHVVLAGGMPKANIMEALKAANVKIMAFAPILAIAKKLVRMGCDAIIIEGSEAGGHIGPVSTFVLAQEILPHITEVPVFVAGGIARGEAISSLLMMGASGCQLGTRFVCATESIAHDNFKRSFIRASARDATSSIQLDPDFPVIPVRAITNEATIEFANSQRQAISSYKSGDLSKDEAQLDIEHYWAGALKNAVIDGDVKKGSIMAGQSVGMVEKLQSAEQIIAELIEQAEQMLKNNFNLLNQKF